MAYSPKSMGDHFIFGGGHRFLPTSKKVIQYFKALIWISFQGKTVTHIILQQMTASKNLLIGDSEELGFFVMILSNNFFFHYKPNFECTSPYIM